MPFYAKTIAATGTQVYATNMNRQASALYNNGTETIYLSNDPPGSIALGFPLLAGKVASFSVVDGDDPGFQLWAMSTSTNNDVRVYEGFGPQGGQ